MLFLALSLVAQPMPNVQVGQGMKLQMGGSQDTPLSGKDLCLSCHATVHSLLKKRKPPKLLTIDANATRAHFSAVSLSMTQWKCMFRLYLLGARLCACMYVCMSL